MKLPLLSLCVALTAALTSCNHEVKCTHAVYVWDDPDSYRYFSDEESEAIFKNDIRKIYCKLTDVIWTSTHHAEPTDVQDLPFDHTIAKYADIIPCIFFTNEVMLNSSKEELEYMAEKIAIRMNTYKVKECQMDCDWTESSKENYFHFLSSIKANLDTSVALSATIRLYQYKYPEKTGVPPADRGMLMLYNFNSPTLYDGKNAIFEKEEAEKYMDRKSYDLPLDFAIAHYQWNVLYDEGNEFIGFVSNEDTKRLMEHVKVLKKDFEFELNEDVSISGYYARKGQKLVTYMGDSKTVDQSMDLVKALANSESFSVALFDLNERTLEYLLSDESQFAKSTH